jgi:hypothetical protein
VEKLNALTVGTELEDKDTKKSNPNSTTTTAQSTTAFPPAQHCRPSYQRQCFVRD